MSNIRVPVMPEPEGKIAYTGAPYESDWVSSQDAFSEDQLAARDAQWQEMVGPLAKAALLAIAALERTHHATEQDRESAANELRAALSAITKD